MIRARAHAHTVQQHQRTFLCRALVDAIGQLRQDHVFQRAELGQKMVELIDEPDVATACGGAAAVAIPRKIAPADDDLAGVRLIQQARDMQQGRFSRPRGRDQCRHLTGHQGQRRLIQNADFVGTTGVIGLGNPDQFQCSIVIHSAAPQQGSYGPHGARGKS